MEEPEEYVKGTRIKEQGTSQGSGIKVQVKAQGTRLKKGSRDKVQARFKGQGSRKVQRISSKKVQGPGRNKNECQCKLLRRGCKIQHAEKVRPFCRFLRIEPFKKGRTFSNMK